jgi:hypothetical protein
MEFYAHNRTEAEQEEELIQLWHKMAGSDIIDKYRSHHYKAWEPDPAGGYTTLAVLPQFIGKRLDNSLFAYLHALRPSAVRISYGEVTCDSKPWRVTVIIEKRDGVDYIQDITQEVSIGCGSGYDVAMVFEHIHVDNRREIRPAPRVIGHVDAITKCDFS